MTTVSFRAFAAAAVTALALAACGGSTTDDGSPTGGSEPTGAETSPSSADFALVNDGTLTVCSEVPYAPFEMRNDDGTYSGFDMDLMAAIADELGLEFEVVESGFDAITSGSAMAAGDCDVAASAITITDEREENVDFSDGYFDADQSLLVPVGSDIASADDLADKIVGVQSGTTGEAYAKDNVTATDIRSFENGAELFVALEAGDIDAVLQDLPVNVERAREDDQVEVVQTFPTGETYGFAVQEEGKEDLLDAVNAALLALRDNGTYDQIYDEYFGT